MTICHIDGTSNCQNPDIVIEIEAGRLPSRFLPQAFEAIPRLSGRKDSMSFGIYIVGFLIVIGGLIYGAAILHVAAHWIAVGAIVLFGLAILKGVQATRGKDPSQ